MRSFGPVLPVQHCDRPHRHIKTRLLVILLVFTRDVCSSCYSTFSSLYVHVSVHECVSVWVCMRTCWCHMSLSPRYSFISAKRLNSPSVHSSQHTQQIHKHSVTEENKIPTSEEYVIKKKKRKKNCRKVFMHACVIPCGFSSSGPWHFIRPLLESLNPNLWYSIILIKSRGL